MCGISRYCLRKPRTVNFKTHQPVNLEPKLLLQTKLWVLDGKPSRRYIQMWQRIDIRDLPIGTGEYTYMTRELARRQQWDLGNHKLVAYAHQLCSVHAQSCPA
jgi:hypothetical protein